MSLLRSKIFQIAKTCLSSKNARHSKNIERLPQAVLCCYQPHHRPLQLCWFAWWTWTCFITINVRKDVISSCVDKKQQRLIFIFVYHSASMASIYFYFIINRSDFLRNDWQFAIGSFERSNRAKSKTPTIST